MPRVSVVMPCRNADATIVGAVTSITSQTYRDLELVLVDDASSLPVEEVLSRARVGDPRVRVVRNDRALGVGESLSRAIEATSGELIVRADADDRSRRDRVSSQVAFMDAHPDADVVASTLAQRTAKARPLPRTLGGVPTSPEALRWSLLVLNTIPHASATLRRSFLERAGGYDPRQGFEDYDLWLRTWCDLRCYLLPKPLVDYRLAGQSATSTARAERHRDLLGLLAERWRTAGLSVPAPGALLTLLDPRDNDECEAGAAEYALLALRAWLEGFSRAPVLAEHEGDLRFLREVASLKLLLLLTNAARSGPQGFSRALRRSEPLWRVLGASSPTTALRLGLASIARHAAASGIW